MVRRICGQPVGSGGCGSGFSPRVTVTAWLLRWPSPWRARRQPATDGKHRRDRHLRRRTPTWLVRSAGRAARSARAQRVDDHTPVPSPPRRLRRDPLSPAPRAARPAARAGRPAAGAADRWRPHHRRPAASWSRQCLDDVAHLEGDGVQGGAYQVGARGAARDAEDGSARCGIPVGRAEPRSAPGRTRRRRCRARLRPAPPTRPPNRSRQGRRAATGSPRRSRKSHPLARRSGSPDGSIQATVVSSPASERTSSEPVLTSTKDPVP